jgi:hypothetical protein
MELVCIGCGKHPHEIEEYVEAAKEEKMTPDDYVRQEEGTYNPKNGHFACTTCYIKMGMPDRPYPDYWVAP